MKPAGDARKSKKLI